MPKIESEKIDCLHRPCSRPAPRGKIESVLTHSEVIELLFLVRNWHCLSRKSFPRQMTPQSREKNCETAIFRHRSDTDRHEKLYGRSRLYASAQGRHETVGVLSLFSSLSFDISIKKQRAEEIFRFSRPVSCKKQENGSGKQRSLLAPLN